MADALGLSLRLGRLSIQLGICLALAGVTACGNAPAPPVTARVTVQSPDTVRLATGDSLRTSAGLFLHLQDVAIKLTYPERRSILRANMTLRDSSGSEKRSLRSDKGWSRALGWEINLLDGSDTSVVLAIRRAPANAPADLDSGRGSGRDSDQGSE